HACHDGAAVVPEVDAHADQFVGTGNVLHGFDGARSDVHLLEDCSAINGLIGAGIMPQIVAAKVTRALACAPLDIFNPLHSARACRGGFSICGQPGATSVAGGSFGRVVAQARAHRDFAGAMRRVHHVNLHAAESAVPGHVRGIVGQHVLVAHV